MLHKEKCMHIYVLIYTQIVACQLKGSGSKNIPVAVNILSIQIVANIVLQEKGDQRSLDNIQGQKMRNY